MNPTPTTHSLIPTLSHLLPNTYSLLPHAYFNSTFLPVRIELGRRDMVIIDGVYESIRTGKKVELKYA